MKRNRLILGLAAVLILVTGGVALSQISHGTNLDSTLQSDMEETAISSQEEMEDTQQTLDSVTEQADRGVKVTVEDAPTTVQNKDTKIALGDNASSNMTGTSKPETTAGETKEQALDSTTASKQEADVNTPGTSKQGTSNSGTSNSGTSTSKPTVSPTETSPYETTASPVETVPSETTAGSAETSPSEPTIGSTETSDSTTPTNPTETPVTPTKPVILPTTEESDSTPEVLPTEQPAGEEEQNRTPVVPFC